MRHLQEIREGFAPSHKRFADAPVGYLRQRILNSFVDPGGIEPPSIACRASAPPVRQGSMCGPTANRTQMTNLENLQSIH